METLGTLRRSALLLRALAADHYQGRALTDLSQAVALPHPTVHRLLTHLIAEGLVVQVAESKRYRLGPLVYELGLAAANSYDAGLFFRPAIERVAKATGDTCYIILRSGLEAVCVARAEGAHPIRTLTLNIGSRRPLGVGAGGLAILAACSKAEAEWIAEATSSSMKRFGKLTVARQRAAIEGSRRMGYSTITNQVQLGVTGIGLAFRDPNGVPCGAMSVGAVNERLPLQRHPWVVDLLHKAVHEIEQGLKTLRPRA